MLTIRRIWFPLTAVALVLAGLPAGAEETSFSAKLTGAAHLPEPIDTKAEGELKLVASADGKTIRYTLTVTNIRNPSAAELHLGTPIANGPVVARLFPTASASAKKGDYSGVLAEGTIDAADLVGPMTGSSMADLLAEIRDGNSYVNVHTNDGAEPHDTGPGDHPLGEIRGQIN